MRLVDELGFDPVDAGTLDDSWRQQPGTPVYAAGLRRRGCPTGAGRGEPGAQRGLAGKRERPWGFRPAGLIGQCASVSGASYG